MDIANIMNRTAANHRISMLELDEKNLKLLEEIFRYEIDIFKFAERALYDKITQFNLDAAEFEEVRFAYI